MAAEIKGFFRKNGRVIPIREASGKGAHTSVHPARSKLKSAVDYAKDTKEDLKSRANKHLKKLGTQAQMHVAPIKVNNKLDALGLGLSVASGVVGAATLAGGAKVFAAGIAGSHVIDAIGIGANAASVAGRGRKVERAKQGARQELRNLIVGNAVYALGAMGTKRNREAVTAAARTAVTVTRKLVFRR